MFVTLVFLTLLLLMAAESIHSHKNSNGTLCNIIGGSIPRTAKRKEETAQAPQSVRNDDNDPEGGKVIVDKPNTPTPGKGMVSVPEGGARDEELGGTGAPGIDIDQIQRDAAQANGDEASKEDSDEADDLPTLETPNLETQADEGAGAEVDGADDESLPPTVRINRRNRGSAADSDE